MIRALTERPEPYVKELPPSPGSRAERYMQLLAPGLHEIGESAPDSATPSSSAPASPNLAARVTQLESEVRSLRELLSKLASAVGEETIALASREGSHKSSDVRDGAAL
jgi:uncharacterized protein YceH (UPF0502 family)